MGQAVHQRLAALEAQVERQGEVSDKNTDMFVSSLRTLEAMQFIQRRITNDVLNQTVRCVGDKEAETEAGLPVRTQHPLMVDFASYLVEYDVCMTFAAFANWLANLAPKEQLVQEATTTDVIEFGG